MIRAAKFADVPRLIELMADGYSRSRYREKSAFDPKEARTLLQNCIARHGAPNEGGTMVMVSDPVESFMIGIRERVYFVGTALVAKDLFLYATETASPFDSVGLVNAYVDWAKADPKVIEIQLSATDVIQETGAAEAMYRHMGFRRSGAIYERSVP
jgi:hypothetical protein